MSYSQNQNRIQKIKALINSYFTSPEIRTSIKNMIQEENLNWQDLDENQLMEFLKKTNLTDKLMTDLEKLEEIEKFNQKTKTLIESTPNFLHNSRGITLKILEGKAFVEYIENYDKTEQFIIDLSFLKHRFRSKPINVSHEPKFNEVSKKLNIILNKILRNFSSISNFPMNIKQLIY